ncbi:tRNA 2-thiocytidine biosynthesis TtcA family protein [Fusobacterium sp. MFO224]|uniref:tRNA 2-thiocytidine biosynthesis TtcA family protein n=1 Tax=Fusobacterium sp. MFO224 TaxID=3378070 RepID=UPI003852D1B2
MANIETKKERDLLKFIEAKGYNKVLWNKIGKAMHQFNMIEEGDKIVVGVSGGKDSLILLNALTRIKLISNIKFEIVPVHIHMDEDISDLDEINKYCEFLGVKLEVIKTKLDKLVTGETKEKNPCFLCGRLRRGILYSFMKEKKIKKLALGHHKDDIIETFLMNVIYQGNRNIMKPSYISESNEIRVIRPMSFVEEKDLIRYSNRLKLPILKNKCPYEDSKDSKRLKIKNIITDLSLENKDVRSVILNSIKDLF